MESRIVDIDFYNLLDKSEIHASYENNEPQIYALIDFDDLNKFAKIVGPSYFDDGGIETILMDGYAVVRVDYIITEYFGHEIEAYKNAIGEDVYEMYISF